MKFLDKIKLLFKIQKPAGEVLDAVAEAKKTKKWIHFTVTILGVALTTAGTLTGFVPPQTMVIVTSILQAIYNIVRGADKADNSDIKGTVLTTEFWMSALTEAQKALVVAHDGGVSAAWITSATSLVGAALAFGQNLSARAPDPAGLSKGMQPEAPLAKS